MTVPGLRPIRSEESRLGLKEQLDHNTMSTEASFDPLESSGAEMVLLDCPPSGSRGKFSHWIWAASGTGPNLDEFIFSQGFSEGIPSCHSPHTQPLGNWGQDLATTEPTHCPVLASAPANWIPTRVFIGVPLHYQLPHWSDSATIKNEKIELMTGSFHLWTPCTKDFLAGTF